MAAKSTTSLSSALMMIALLFVVLMFGTWYRNEAFQNFKPTAAELKAKQTKDLAYLASNKTTTQDPSKTMDFQTALNNVLKTTGMTNTSSPQYGKVKNALNATFFRK
jgi:hypothetical protein